MSRLGPKLTPRSGYELRVIGYLSDVWPFYLPPEGDALDSAALAMNTLKKKHADFWESVQEVNCHPEAVASMIVDIMLSEMRSSG